MDDKRPTREDLQKFLNESNIILNEYAVDLLWVFLEDAMDKAYDEGISEVYDDPS